MKRALITGITKQDGSYLAELLLSKDYEAHGLIRRASSLASALTSALKIGDVLIKIDPHYFRPTEVNFLLADASKAREKLGWEPKVKFKELVKIMVDADMELKGLNSPSEGQRILKEKGIDWTKNQVIIK